MAGASLHRIELIGRLVRDPVFSTTSNGKDKAEFTLVTDDGSRENPKATYHQITTWEKLANNCAQYCHKGQLVRIEGRINYGGQQIVEQDQNGRDVKKTIYQYQAGITANQVLFLSSPNSNSNGGGSGDSMPDFHS